MQNSVTPNNITDAVNKLAAWADQWQLSINISKCHVLHLGRNNPRLTYCINNCTISDEDVVTDLGVDIDIGLKYDVHIDNIIKKARQRISLIFRGFQSRKPELLVKAYISFVRPVLEYCSCVWSPVLITRINALERVQKYFTKKLLRMADLNYSDRLCVLNLETLEMRRLKLDIYLYFKILHNLVAIPAEHFRYDDRQLK